MKKNTLFLFLIVMNFVTSICFAQVDLNKGLIAYYPMNGNAKSTIGSGLDLTVNGAQLTTDRYQDANSAYYFNGSTSLLGNINTTGFTGMSFSAWINTSYTSGPEVVMQVTGDVIYVNRFSSDHFMAGMDASTGNNDNTNESQSSVENGWTFISVSNDGSTTRLYVNGKLENSYPETLYTSNSQIEIGGGVGNATTQFYGSIDEVKVYNRQLSDAEMLALYDSCPVNLHNGIVAWYPLNGNAKSVVGAGLDLTDSDATLTTDRFERPNSAYSFNGSSHLIGNFNTTGYNGLTLSAWIQTAYTSNPEVALQVTGDVFYINRFSPGYFMAALDANSNDNANTDQSLTNVATGNWVFVAASNDGYTTRLYVNGIFENSYQETLFTKNGQIEIGGGIGNNTTEFHGSIDDVRIYDRVLCDDEINSLYQDTSSSSGIAINAQPKESFNIYPNPSRGQFTIKAENLEMNSLMEVYDMSGKTVYARRLQNNKPTLDLSTLKPGIYILSIQTSDAVFGPEAHYRIISASSGRASSYIAAKNLTFLTSLCFEKGFWFQWIGKTWYLCPNKQ